MRQKQNQVCNVVSLAVCNVVSGKCATSFHLSAKKGPVVCNVVSSSALSGQRRVHTSMCMPGGRTEERQADEGLSSEGDEGDRGGCSTSASSATVTRRASQAGGSTRKTYRYRSARVRRVRANYWPYESSNLRAAA
jgi:hypothetical protein